MRVEMRKPINLISIILVLLLMSSVPPVYASSIVQIAVDESGIPFLLDDEGHVWGFRKPLSLEEPIKLPNLERIKMIAPYIASDVEGRIFTWHLDESRSNRDQGQLIEAAYTEPNQFGDFIGVTLIANSLDHFVAVIRNRDIVDWTEIQDSETGIINSSSIRKIISQDGVKAISVATAPGGGLKGSHFIFDGAFGLVALFDDGAVIGWGINNAGEIITRRHKQKLLHGEWVRMKESAWPSKLLTKLPGAIGIAMDNRHVVILSKEGVPQYWGGCGYFAVNRNNKPMQAGVLKGGAGYIDGAASMALRGGDEMPPDLYIKRDGSVWAAYAPSAPDIPDICLGATLREQKTLQFLLGDAPAIQVAIGGSTRLILDSKHQLWAAFPQAPFSKVSIPLN